ncbi:hypothetical protein ACWGH2_24525 [Streptomyces sp. NPDC054871]
MHAVLRFCRAAEVALGFGLVVHRHLGELGGQQPGVDDCLEPIDGAFTVFVLAPGQRAQHFHQGIGRTVQLSPASEGRDKRLPDGVGDVLPRGGGEPVQVEAQVGGQGEALAQACDQQPPVGPGALADD